MGGFRKQLESIILRLVGLLSPESIDSIPEVQRLLEQVRSLQAQNTQSEGTVTAAVRAQALLFLRLYQHNHGLANDLLTYLESKGWVETLSRSKKLLIPKDDEREEWLKAFQYELSWMNGFVIARMDPKHAALEIEVSKALSDRRTGIQSCRMQYVPPDSADQSASILVERVYKDANKRGLVFSADVLRARPALQPVIFNYALRATILFQQEFSDLPEQTWALHDRMANAFARFDAYLPSFFSDTLQLIERTYANKGVYCPDRRVENMVLDTRAEYGFNEFKHTYDDSKHRAILQARIERDFEALDDALCLPVEELYDQWEKGRPIDDFVRHLDLVHISPGRGIERAPACHSLAPILYSEIELSSVVVETVLKQASQYSEMQSYGSIMPVFLHGVHIMSVFADGRKYPQYAHLPAQIARDLSRFIQVQTGDSVVIEPTGKGVLESIVTHDSLLRKLAEQSL